MQKFSQFVNERSKVGDYVVGSGTVFHDQYTVFKGKKELESLLNVGQVLDFILD